MNKTTYFLQIKENYKISITFNQYIHINTVVKRL